MKGLGFRVHINLAFFWLGSLGFRVLMGLGLRV